MRATQQVNTLVFDLACFKLRDSCTALRQYMEFPFSVHRIRPAGSIRFFMEVFV